MTPVGHSGSTVKTERGPSFVRTAAFSVREPALRAPPFIGGSFQGIAKARFLGTVACVGKSLDLFSNRSVLLKGCDHEFRHHRLYGHSVRFVARFVVHRGASWPHEPVVAVRANTKSTFRIRRSSIVSHHTGTTISVSEISRHRAGVNWGLYDDAAS